MAIQRIGTPRTTPIGERETAAPWEEGRATQRILSHAIEFKDSRQISIDIQREKIIHTYIIAGRPDQARLDASKGGLKWGMPHADIEHAYVTNINYTYHVFGPDTETAGDGEFLTPGQARDSSAYTKVTVTYTQRPCLGKWEEETSTVLVSRLEWFDKTEQHNPLTDTRQGTPLLFPVPTYKRHFPLVILARTKVDTIRREQSKLNFFVWQDEAPRFWQMTGCRIVLLWGDPTATTAAYDVTLMWRGDPERLHDWWWPEIVGQRPINTFNRRQVYEQTSLDWDVLVPLPVIDCWEAPVPPEP